MNASAQYLEFIKSTASCLPVPFDILTRHGREYEVKSTILTGVMELGHCFRNTLNGMNSRQFYCEGYAIAPGLFPMLHAWIEDRDGKAIDPTWAQGAEYFGVRFDYKFAKKHALRTGYYGIFEGLHRLRMSPEEVTAYLEGGIAK